VKKTITQREHALDEAAAYNPVHEAATEYGYLCEAEIPDRQAVESIVARFGLRVALEALEPFSAWAKQLKRKAPDADR